MCTQCLIIWSSWPFIYTYRKKSWFSIKNWFKIFHLIRRAACIYLSTIVINGYRIFPYGLWIPMLVGVGNSKIPWNIVGWRKHCICNEGFSQVLSPPKMDDAIKSVKIQNSSISYVLRFSLRKKYISIVSNVKNIMTISQGAKKSDLIFQ